MFTISDRYKHYYLYEDPEQEDSFVKIGIGYFGVSGKIIANAKDLETAKKWIDAGKPSTLEGVWNIRY